LISNRKNHQLRAMLTPSPYNDPSQSRPRPLNKRQWRERGSLRYTLASLISCTCYFHISAFQDFKMSGLLYLWISAFLDFRSSGLCNVLNISRSRFAGISNHHRHVIYWFRAHWLFNIWPFLRFARFGGFWIYGFLDFLILRILHFAMLSESSDNVLSDFAEIKKTHNCKFASFDFCTF